MRKLGMLMVVATMGCATTQLGDANATATAPRPLLRVFESGSGRVVDFESGRGPYEQAWETGVLPGASSHGAPVRDSGWTARREGTLQINHRTQLFSDGTTIYRELAADPSGHLVRVRFYDTHIEGVRHGFRLDGTLPDGVAFGSAPIGGALSAAR